MNANLVVALDFPGAGEAFALAEKLRGVAPWMKVGLELFTAEGPRMVSGLRDKGFRVFLDLKFHDIPNTVKGAAKSAASLGADLITLHHAGGERMAASALEGVREAGRPVLVFAVSILTSASPREAGFASAAEVTEAVAAKAREAKAWGLPGLVCSGHEASAVKAACGPDFLCLCPGIRMAGDARGDQSRVMTPAEAIAAGADFLVMGRPITQAADPRGAAKAALENMTSARN
ncbi:MAG: orotidine-5'-phosphate decarboxylase [Deltaproteobacteria bacterium]|nr:orotidine-5'-phosphate decarboxylase [Deltaproteobacteria bacterium]